MNIKDFNSKFDQERVKLSDIQNLINQANTPEGGSWDLKSRKAIENESETVAKTVSAMRNIRDGGVKYIIIGIEDDRSIEPFKGNYEKVSKKIKGYLKRFLEGDNTYECLSANDAIKLQLIPTAVDNSEECYVAILRVLGRPQGENFLSTIKGGGGSAAYRRIEEESKQIGASEIQEQLKKEWSAKHDRRLDRLEEEVAKQTDISNHIVSKLDSIVSKLDSIGKSQKKLDIFMAAKQSTSKQEKLQLRIEDAPKRVSVRVSSAPTNEADTYEIENLQDLLSSSYALNSHFSLGEKSVDQSGNVVFEKGILTIDSAGKCTASLSNPTKGDSRMPTYYVHEAGVIDLYFLAADALETALVLDEEAESKGKAKTPQSRTLTIEFEIPDQIYLIMRDMSNLFVRWDGFQSVSTPKRWSASVQYSPEKVESNIRDILQELFTKCDKYFESLPRGTNGSLGNRTIIDQVKFSCSHFRKLND